MKHADINHLFSHNTRVLTVNEVSIAVRCSPSHILDLIHSDELPCFHVGRQYRVLKSDVISCFTTETEKPPDR